MINKIKGSIRKSEAYEACKFLGLKNKEKIHFLVVNAKLVFRFHLAEIALG